MTRVREDQPREAEPGRARVHPVANFARPASTTRPARLRPRDQSDAMPGSVTCTIGTGFLPCLGRGTSHWMSPLNRSWRPHFEICWHSDQPLIRPTRVLAPFSLRSPIPSRQIKSRASRVSGTSVKFSGVRLSVPSCCCNDTKPALGRGKISRAENRRQGQPSRAAHLTRGKLTAAPRACYQLSNASIEALRRGGRRGRVCPLAWEGQLMRRDGSQRGFALRRTAVPERASVSGTRQPRSPGHSRLRDEVTVR